MNGDRLAGPGDSQLAEQEIQIGGGRSGRRLRLAQGTYRLVGAVWGKGCSNAGMPVPRPTAQQWWLSCCTVAACRVSSDG